MEYALEILRSDVQDFIEAHLHEDIHRLLLRKSPFGALTMQLLVQQIKGRQVARRKFPFLDRRNIIFPPQLNLEQASSEATATFKANLLRGRNMADLTAGFGIDAYFISKNFEEVSLVEQNPELSAAVAHNWELLERKAQFFSGSLEDFLTQTRQKFDLLYLDPARRDQSNRKKFLLEDLTPDLLQVLPVLMAKTSRVMVKLSPLIDLSYLISVLESISEIYILSVKNETKEVVLMLDFEASSFNNPKISAVNLDASEPHFAFYFNEEKNALPEFGEPQQWLYLPNSSVLKSGAFNLLCSRFNVQKLHANTHLYTSAERVEGFPGRVLQSEIVDPKNIRKGEKYNIVTRNYPLTPAEVKKKYKISDGGNQYLIFAQGPARKYVLKGTP